MGNDVGDRTFVDRQGERHSVFEVVDHRAGRVSEFPDGYISEVLRQIVSEAPVDPGLLPDIAAVREALIEDE